MQLFLFFRYFCSCFLAPIFLAALGLLGCLPAAIPSTTTSLNSGVRLEAIRLLGSVGCPTSARTAFVIQCRGSLSSEATQGKVGVLAMPVGSTLHTELLDWAARARGQAGTVVWNPEGSFVFWQKGTMRDPGNVVFALNESSDRPLEVRNYTLYLLHENSGRSSSSLTHSTTGLELNLPPAASLDGKALELRATGYETQQIGQGVKWRLEGSTAKQVALPEGALGFLLVPVGKNPYTCLQKAIGSGALCSTQPTVWRGCLLVPGLRCPDGSLVGELCSKDIPMKGGSFALFCYVKRGTHFYLGQAASLAPPLLSLQGTGYKLITPLEVALACLSRSGRLESVQLTNRTKQPTLPDDLEPCLLFFRKGTTWHKEKLEALFAQLHAAQRNASTDGAHAFCLTTAASQTLDPTCLPFFAPKSELNFFFCLFSKKEKTLKYYTEKQSLVPTHTARQASFTLQLTGTASLSIADLPAGAEVRLSLPAVSLSDESEWTQKGFLFARSAALAPANLGPNRSEVAACLATYLREGCKEAVYRKPCLIGTAAEHLQTCFAACHQKKVWTPEGLNDLAVVGWVQLADGKVAFSNAVPVEVAFKERKQPPSPAIVATPPPLSEPTTAKTSEAKTGEAEPNKSQNKGFWSWLLG